MNQEARDGTFGFTVFNVWTDKQVGTHFSQGVFVEIAMDVKNIGTTQQRYFAVYQRLLDSEGRVFSPDVDTKHGLFTVRADINPGNKLRTAVAFDVPEGTQPSDYVLVLHGSPDSAGVTVRLK